MSNGQKIKAAKKADQMRNATGPSIDNYRRECEADIALCIERAPAKRGRPAIDGTNKKAQVVYLAASHVATAKALGDGNTSAGVRLALEMAARKGKKP